MKIDDVEYSFVLASDGQRNGLGFEVYRQDPVRELVLEVFRDDGARSYAVSQFVPGLPLLLVEYVANVARDELGDFAADPAA
ncbi:MAG: hypothetical protein ACJ8GW_02570 [Massilia sp.]